MRTHEYKCTTIHQSLQDWDNSLLGFVMLLCSLYARKAAQIRPVLDMRVLVHLHMCT